MEDQNVRNLKSRFEQLHVKPKPALPTKPSATRTLNGQAQEATSSQRTTSDSVVDHGDEYIALSRRDTIDSQLSDPFNSPLNSPVIDKVNIKPGLPPNKPRYSAVVLPSRSSTPAVTNVANLNDAVFPQCALLSVPDVGPMESNPSSPSRPGSARPAPPPPSPRLKSPRPMARSSDSRPSSQILARNIFEDEESSSLVEAQDLNAVQDVSTPPKLLRPVAIKRLSTDTRVIDAHIQYRLDHKSMSPASDNKAITHIQNADRSSHQKYRLPGKQIDRDFSAVENEHKTLHPDQEDVTTRPALPLRPTSQHITNSSFSSSVGSIAVASGQKPTLPRRVDAARVMPPPVLPRRGETPDLPTRPQAGESNKHITLPSRQSLQHERPSVELPAAYRRSLDECSSTPKPQRQKVNATIEDSDAEEESSNIAENVRALDQPDPSTANRKPPRFKGTNWDLMTGKEIRKTAICGDLLMVAHADKLKLHSILTGDIIWQLPVVDTRVTAMDFRTVHAHELDEAGRYLWIGFKDGSLHEVDVKHRIIVERYFHAHNSAIVAILRNKRTMWTLDDGGTLQIWANQENCSLRGRPRSTTLRTVPGINVAIVVAGKLWIGSGRAVHVFDPSVSNHPRLTTDRGMEPNRVAGIITCVVHLRHMPDFVYFGHDDGKISIYSIKELKCLEVISISHYNLSGLLEVGDYLWASFKTGKIFVYDVHCKPWRVMKEWHAHKSPILELSIDRYGLWQEKRLQVSSMAGDGAVKIWDGLLMEDWLDAEMQRRLKEFCTFRETSALVCTWNAGASVPQKLVREYEDAQFIENMIRQARSPDLIIFGFQELIDLEDKGKAGRSVAKGFFGKKKEKEPDEKAQAVAYQQWQAHLEKQVAIASSTTDDYKLLQVRNLVGLFTCLFVKRKLHDRISNVDASSVKTGLKGRYGNKGAIVIRLTLDDTSLCFINCHLAAGQKNVTNRNNDIFSILDQAGLPASADKHRAPHTFVSGGDGSMVLDHEICVLNGDLNYRINGNRSQVIQNIKEGRLEKLLENDQLLLELKKNATHRMRSFTESTITFNPTYKYDPGTDNYDSSEKMRVPAWCDRIYYRGLGASDIRTSSYQAHVCRVSDHRPVSAILQMRVKTVDDEHRKNVYSQVTNQWIDLANKTIVARKIAVLKEVTSRSEKECKEMLRNTHGQVVSDAAKAFFSS